MKRGVSLGAHCRGPWRPCFAQGAPRGCRREHDSSAHVCPFADSMRSRVALSQEPSSREQSFRARRGAFCGHMVKYTKSGAPLLSEHTPLSLSQLLRAR